MLMQPEELHHRLKALLLTVPGLQANSFQSDEALSWLGNVLAAVEQTRDIMDIGECRAAISNLTGPLPRSDAITTIRAVLARALARLEMRLPAAAAGNFIPVGAPFAAMAAVQRVLLRAKREVFLIDPYADARLLTDFAVAAPEAAAIRILADAASKKDSLKPAAERWIKQNAEGRPLDVRLAKARSLHDRLIVLDGSEGWVLGQSFNALADRAPTSLLRMDPETAALKLAAHQQLWDEATPLL